jgi:ribose-phosphate pyrophosphokinase
MKNAMVVVAGNASKALAQKVCDYLRLQITHTDLARFPDGEIDCRVLEDVRGSDVYVVQSTCPPVNENIMELLILIDCLRRASAERITAVIPYFGYARQDRKAEGRVPISAKLVANMITTAGAHRALSMDLHAAQIQGFFDIPMDHLYAAPAMIEYIKKLALSDLTVVTADVGGIKMARAYAKRLGADLAICDKRRSGPTETEVMHVIGNVEGRNVLIVDDMISTATSVADAARALKKHNAKDVYIVATHPVLAGKAVEKLAKAPIKEIIVSDTIPVEGKELPNLRVLSIANLLGEAIRRIHKSESVSSLFV